MSDAPERIYVVIDADDEGMFIDGCSFYERSSDEQIEYIRADQIKEVIEDINKLLFTIKVHGFNGPLVNKVSKSIEGLVR